MVLLISKPVEVVEPMLQKNELKLTNVHNFLDMTIWRQPS